MFDTRLERMAYNVSGQCQLKSDLPNDWLVNVNTYQNLKNDIVTKFDAKGTTVEEYDSVATRDVEWTMKVSAPKYGTYPSHVFQMELTRAKVKQGIGEVSWAVRSYGDDGDLFPDGYGLDVMLKISPTAIIEMIGNVELLGASYTHKGFTYFARQMFKAYEDTTVNMFFSTYLPIKGKIGSGYQYWIQYIVDWGWQKILGEEEKRGDIDGLVPEQPSAIVSFSSRLPDLEYLDPPGGFEFA